MPQDIELGRPTPRTEDMRLLTGGGSYVDDNALPRETRAYILRSPHAHAKIRAIDTAAAKAAPGVLLVLTGADYTAAGLGIPECLPKRKRRDGTAMFEPKNRPLVLDGVRMIGDNVAIVVAETINQAKDAAELIAVDYEPLPSVSSPWEAVQPGAPLVWAECANNICFIHTEGNKQATDAAFAGAAHVIRRRLPVNRTAHMTMEPRGAIGDYNPRADQWTLYTGCHYPWGLREELATQIFRVPENRIRVIGGDMGGSFGLRGGTYHEQILVTWASRLIGRPVKWVCERSESFLSDHHGRDVVWEGELALDKDGKFLAVRVKSCANVGAYLASKGTLPPVANLGSIAGTYVIPAMHVDVTAAFTNTNPLCPFRGNGRPEASYLIERLIDLAADELVMDPVDIRRRNSIPPHAMPYKTALTFTYDCGHFDKNIQMATKTADWSGFPTRRAESARRGKLRGIGISSTIERAASPSFESAMIRFDPSGTVTLHVGTTQQGQGHETIYKQIICGKLGLKSDSIRVVEGDTATLAFGGGTGGSRSATLGGSVVLLATDKIIAKGKRIASHLLEAAEVDIDFVDGAFRVAGTDRSVGMGEVVKIAYNRDKLPADVEPGFEALQMFSTDRENFPNGCHVCEVEIDEDTGVVDVARYHVVDDVGTVLNPLTLEGQVQGGVVHGIGQALLEHIRFDPDSGQLLSGSFMDYTMPRADDLTFIEIESNPVPTKTNPLGCKGAGEAGTVGAVPAVMNAVVDALSPLGIRHIDMPATPERVWAAIQQARKLGGNGQSAR
jgi:aerobic carbon-monoxide dehydrogenase large subunit